MQLARRFHATSQRLYRGWRRLLCATYYRALFGRLGAGTILYPFNLLLNPQWISIGARSLVRRGCRLEVVLHGQSWTPQLVIGDNVNIEQNVHIVCHDRIVIGDSVSITGHCAIVDVSHPHDAFAQGRKPGDAIDEARSFVEIGAGSFIGFGTVILPNVRIGRGCMIGAGSVVNSDIPDYAVAAGVPARVLRTDPPAREQGSNS